MQQIANNFFPKNYLLNTHLLFICFQVSHINIVSKTNKCSDRSMEVELSSLLGNYDRPTDQPTIGQEEGSCYN